MKVIGFTGYAQSGKDTAATFLVDVGWKRLAFADILRESLYNLNPIVEEGYVDEPESSRRWWPEWRAVTNEKISKRVQDIVDISGWDFAKTHYPEIRQLLQRFGTEVGRELYGQNFWVDRVIDQIREQPNESYVITDVRFPNELAAVRGLGGEVYKIQRPGNKPANAHASEDIDHLRVDGVIPNTGSLDRFRDLVLSTAGVTLN